MSQHQECLIIFMFIYVCGASLLEIVMWGNSTEQSCKVGLSMISMNTTQYLSGFAIVNFIQGAFFIFAGFCMALFKQNDPYPLMFFVVVINLFWRFIWGIVGLVIVFKDLKPNSLCLSIVNVLQADVYIYYIILVLAIVIHLNSTSNRRRVANQTPTNSQIRL